jgi:glucose/arabinose dehydrogenase
MEERWTPTTLPPGFVETTVASGISSGTAMDFAPDGRLFVLEQSGNVKLVHSDGTTWVALHLNVDSAGERGLLGIAFDPNFASNHYVYLYYTNPNPGAAPWATGEHNQLSRFTVNDANPQQPVFTAEAPILDWNNLSSATNHNGGAIHFGLDGMLYADAGDNVQTFTLNGNTYRVSQTLGDLLGKQLRIDVSMFNSGVATRDDTTVGHLIPSNNPFVGVATGINQLIYALGLRNPFTFAVQPGTGTIFINDVGENTWEEIDQSIAGGNYGWSGGNTDGFGQTPPGPGTYHDPLLAYNHTGGPAGGGDAIVGGTFYNPPTDQFPSSYVGKYFYEDLDGRWIRVFDPAHPGTISNPDTSTAFATGTASSLRDLKVDSAGSLYYLSGSGVINKISYTAAFPQIGGTWFINGNKTTQIQQNGSTLTFTNENGQSSPGYFQNSTQVVATSWGNLVGTLIPIDDGMRISWANGTAWDQPQLAGQGFIGNKNVGIAQSGNNLTFTNELGNMSAGMITDATHVVATGWGNLVGTLTATFEGYRINWANGTAWDMLRLAGTWSINNQPTQVTQPNNGLSLTFTNEVGSTSPGSIQDTGHVIATGWGNLIGTLVATAGGQIEIDWANGTAWVKPQLAQ